MNPQPLQYVLEGRTVYFNLIKDEDISIKDVSGNISVFVQFKSFEHVLNTPQVFHTIDNSSDWDAAYPYGYQSHQFEWLPEELGTYQITVYATHVSYNVSGTLTEPSYSLIASYDIQVMNKDAFFSSLDFVVRNNKFVSGMEWKDPNATYATCDNYEAKVLAAAALAVVLAVVGCYFGALCKQKMDKRRIRPSMEMGRTFHQPQNNNR